MKTLWILGIAILLWTSPVQAADSIFETCLLPYEPLVLLTVFPVENNIQSWAYLTPDNLLVTAFHDLTTDDHWLVVNNLRITCETVDLGNLPSITLYPLGGTKWTWAVQDVYGHWHTVRLLSGEIVQTPPEYDASGRLITRLVVRRTEPTDPARYHIFDEFGALAG